MDDFKGNAEAMKIKEISEKHSVITEF